ncbi:hypothetical protein K501DRAFT_324214 [Backusella circina FSU 941]|nr:hypothetical protein K501DRAFT_324214 [Backusella circina FSU 941]
MMMLKYVTTILFSILLGFSTSMPLAERSLGSCYKKATMTQYWIPKEGEKDMLNDGKIVTLTGTKNRSLKTVSGKTIAKVSETTYEKFQMEGTGLLKSGVMVNLDSGKDTFLKVNRKTSPYGFGSDESSHLDPWVSVASNDIKHGTKLFIKELEGVKLPDGKVHNGCVRVDDKGWSFGKCQLDFFVLQFSAYQILDQILPVKVTVAQKSVGVTVIGVVADDDANVAIALLVGTDDDGAVAVAATVVVVDAATGLFFFFFIFLDFLLLPVFTFLCLRLGHSCLYMIL